MDRRAVVGGVAATALVTASACRAGAAEPAAGVPVKLALLGQQGHGKTTLAAAVSRIQADAGLANAAAPTAFRTSARAYELIDRPGAPAATADVIAGLCAADAAILLVSAADGPMPQTREHILLARQMRVENMIVFLSKADLNDDAELLELITLETRELLSAYQLKGDEITVVTGSAKAAIEGRGGAIGKAAITRLLEAVDALPSSRRRVGPGAASARRFEVETYILTTEEDGLRGAAPTPWTTRIFFENGLSGQAVIVPAPGSPSILPGENRTVVLDLDAPLAVERVTRFAIRGEGRTLGAGVVVGAG